MSHHDQKVKAKVACGQLVRDLIDVPRRRVTRQKVDLWSRTNLLRVQVRIVDVTKTNISRRSPICLLRNTTAAY